VGGPLRRRSPLEKRWLSKAKEAKIAKSGNFACTTSCTKGKINLLHAE
jgi:hypothetical protein